MVSSLRAFAAAAFAVISGSPFLWSIDWRVRKIGAAPWWALPRFDRVQLDAELAVVVFPVSGVMHAAMTGRAERDHMVVG